MWLSWLEHHPINQKVVGLIPGQGTYLGCTFVPQLGTWERQLSDVSLPLSLLPLPLSLKSISMSSGKGNKKRTGVQLTVG